MARTETVLQAFVASPGDVSNERELLEEVIRELNVTWRSSLGISIDLVRWETHALPGIGSDAQQVINDSIGDDYDIFIGIMWGRFGTPTTKYGSGTEEEFKRAFARWEKDSTSVRIMFYFNNAGISPSAIDPDQLRRIQSFKSSLGDEGALYWHYNGIEHFSKLLRLHLSRVVQEWGSRREISEREAEPSSTTGVEDEKTDSADDLGFLDLLESLEDSILELGDVATRMGEATTEIGATMSDRAEELNELKEDGQLRDFRAAKRIVNRSAQDLDHFTSRLNVDVQNFSDCNLNIADSTSKLATLVGDFSQEDGDALAELVRVLDNLLDPMATLPGNIRGFRDTVHEMPRVSVKFNKSKKAAVAMLDRFLTSIDEALSVSHEARALISQMNERQRNRG